MDKTEALRSFFWALKVTFKNANIYNMGHPAFVKSVEDLKNKIDAVLVFINPLSLGFTSRSLYADEKFWEKEKTYVELARLFHFRKIKRLEIQSGVMLDELMRFASKITLPVRDFIREGGATEILRKEKILHISVEELNYSQLLKGEGEEIRDIWPYLLQEAVEEEDSQKLTEMADSFEKIIDKLDIKELVVDEELQENFSKFFSYLKENEEQKFRKCAKKLVKSLVTNKNINVQAKFDNLKLLISDLKEEDLASTLWEEIITDNEFDSLSFSIFSRLIEREKHLNISTSLRELFQTDDPRNRRPKVEEKIKALLSGTSGHFMSEIYHQTLASLLKDISFEKKTHFDHDRLARNYRFTLLNMLELETARDEMLAFLEQIGEEWTNITELSDFEFLKWLFEVLKIKEEVLSSEAIYQKTRRLISEFVENFILDEQTSPFLDYFILNLTGSLYDTNTYLEKIFSESKITPFILRAYFKFFKECLSPFIAKLNEKRPDRKFLEKLVNSLKEIDTPLSLMILKQVFVVGDDAVKIKVLKTMQSLKEYDKPFLFMILRSKNYPLKAEALPILMRDEFTQRKTLNKLFKIESPYGIRNRVLRNHIKIVENKTLKEARNHLVLLSQRKSFWNRRLRKEASRVLEKWNAG
jgi:hypothetical protein